ncbi:translocation protein [Dacryopinax primogenitus]|uniref:Translocation protein SEC62 n=1 Tax=Dacryopinax primogenitus (strain DJM 731) TaxID=1858805 RepID=M5G235_DACPD|nr:translocation protein [Dacryopinax primogenitus]EJU02275.1 translocation protein [Dacryopinax primogenitus]
MAPFAANQATASPEHKAVANWLRSKSGQKTRVGVLDGQRKDYFKGSAAIKALLSPAYGKLKKAPKVTSEAEATQLMNQLNAKGFFLRVQRGDKVTSTKKAPRTLQIIRQQAFLPPDYYVWLMDGSQLTTYLGGLVMVAVIFAGVMYPLWPLSMRIGAYYLSMGMLGLLGLFFAMTIVRLILYVITWLVLPPGLWIFPQLFADVGFFESFVPLYEWDYPKKKKSKKSKKALKDGAPPGAEKRRASAPPTPASGTKRMPSVLPGMGPPPTPSFGGTQQAFIEEIPDADA